MTAHALPRRRARDLPIPPGYWSAASQPHNAITDVPGVRVAHVTLIRGAGALRPGSGPVRTGITLVLPHAGNLFTEKVTAAAHVINGFGKACGLIQVQELGQIETPIALTNTLSVWQAAQALARAAIAQNPGIGISTSTVNPVVLECNDGYLNDIQGFHVSEADVARALKTARAQPSFAPVDEGNVGGGTGMICYGWKGGAGSAGRRIDLDGRTVTLGALVQTNFGRPGKLRFAGIPIPLRPGDEATQTTAHGSGSGSVIVILATDAPLDARQLRRLCVRAAAGLARTGTDIDHGSGDFVLAFSTGRPIPHHPGSAFDQAPSLIAEDQVMDRLFPAVVEVVEESVLNALCAAETMIGRDGHQRPALPLEQVAARLRQAFG